MSSVPPQLDLSSLPSSFNGHVSDDSEGSSSPSSPDFASQGGRRRSSRVQFSKYIKVSYTFAAEEYDRNPVDPLPMSAKDYYEYQVMAFEMHQAIKFELTMRQLGLWDASTPGVSEVPIVPTIPVVASTLERRREVKSNFSKGTKVVVAKPRGPSLQYSYLDEDEDVEAQNQQQLAAQNSDDDIMVDPAYAARTAAAAAEDEDVDEDLADYERQYAAAAAYTEISIRT
ncbi:hypothetical protein H9P43_005135 [Blastocladiella emersonii ATCC 22665]|nr:hypothetical protein H9P43_005135 [Blastocladiella emersonii ATCC 22665]